MNSETQAAPSAAARIVAAALMAALVVWVVAQALAGWLDATYFNGAAVNGPFQLLDALRRLDAGQRPGLNFPFFHGAGVPWTHYPFYRALGGNLWASEITRQWLSLAAFLTTTAIFGYTALRSRTRTVVFVALTALTASVLGLRDLYGPAHSMLGFRSSAPVLLFALLLTGISQRRKTVFGILLLGVTLLCGTEQGLYTSAACVLAIAMAWLSGSARRPAAEGETQWSTLAAIVVGGWLLYPLLLALACSPSGVAPALRFAFRDLPADQFWFSGVPPSAFPVTLKSFRVLGYPALATIALALLWWVATARQCFRLKHPPMLRLLMLTVGLLACASYLGQLSARYFLPLGRLLVLCALWELLRRFAAGGAEARRAGALLVLWAAIAVPLGLREPLQRARDKRATLAEYDTSHTVSGVWLSRDWSEHLARFAAVAGRPQCADVWSTYTSLIQAELGCLNPAVDYIIHALGPQSRANYASSFERLQPRFVITTRPSTMPWEEQLRNDDWPFYEQLLRRYDVAAMSPLGMIWKKHDGGPAAIEGAEVALPAGRGRIDIPASLEEAGDLAIVHIRYRLENRLKPAPVIGTLPRYLVEIEGALNHTPMSLAPYYTEMSFPVLFRHGSQACLVPHAVSLAPGAAIVVESVTARPVRLGPAQAAFLERGPDFWRP